MEGSTNSLAVFKCTFLNSINIFSSFFLFEIVVAAISSYFLVGEIIALQEWLGGILIIAGVILASKN